MKFALMQLGALTAAVALATVVGHAATIAHWGAAGESALWAAAVICWLGSVVAAIPMPIVAKWAPAQVGQAAFAGTAIRLLVTGLLAVGYQSVRAVHLRAFLTWLVIFYILLLVIDTTFSLMLVRRQYAAPNGRS